jgi:hypothetical protein
VISELFDWLSSKIRHQVNGYTEINTLSVQMKYVGRDHPLALRLSEGGCDV